jgi:hypothetical protein
MPSKRAGEIWNLGIPLSRAWLEFAPPEMRSEFENLSSFVEALSAQPQAETLTDFFSALTNSLSASHRRGQMEADLKERLLTELFNRQFVATGYRVSPTRSRTPVTIDPAYFEFDDPDWHSDSFAAHDLRYSRVRITDLVDCPSAPPRHRGSLDAIERAIDELVAANSAFCGLDRKIACEQIREFLGAEKISGNGLSDQNLSKVIVRKCGPKRIPK